MDVVGEQVQATLTVTVLIQDHEALLDAARAVRQPGPGVDRESVLQAVMALLGDQAFAIPGCVTLMSETAARRKL